MWQVQDVAIAEKRKEFINEQQNSYAEISKKGESDESQKSA